MNKIYAPPQKSWGERNNGFSYKPERNGKNLIVIAIYLSIAIVEGIVVSYGNA